MDIKMQTLPCSDRSHPDETPQENKNQLPYQFHEHLLNRSLVRQRGDSLGRNVGQRDGAGLTGLCGKALDLDGGARGSSLLLGLGVGLDALEEVLTGAGGLDVLDADVDALLDVSVPDLLVDDDADGALGNVVDDAGLAVVDLVGHTVCEVSKKSFRVEKSCQALVNRIRSYPFWTAPLTLMSTMSPTL